MSQPWTAEFASGSPAFAPLQRFRHLLPPHDWPQLMDLQTLLDRAGAVSAGGAPLRLVRQGTRPRRWEDRYEARVYLRAELQVRPGNWHDLFNVLAWAAYPRAKAALNARHYNALLLQHAAGKPDRSPVQDALTLFDEEGVAVASSDSGLLALIDGFAWKELFWHRRDEVRRHMQFAVFGHALFEKLLEPYSGLTGRAVLFEVGTDFGRLASDAQAERFDAMVAARIADPQRLAGTRDLSPLPVLGVPGWLPANERESYYDDRTYFRPGRRLRET